MEAQLLAGLAHRELGDQHAASQAAERALALAESDRLVLPFAMTGSAGLLEALPRHQTAHAESSHRTANHQDQVTTAHRDGHYRRARPFR